MPHSLTVCSRHEHSSRKAHLYSEMFKRSDFRAAPGRPCVSVTIPVGSLSSPMISVQTVVGECETIEGVVDRGEIVASSISR